MKAPGLPKESQVHFPPDVAFNPFPWELKFIFYSREKAEDGGFSL